MSRVTHDQTPAYRIRPRFEVETTHSTEELVTLIKANLSRADAPCKGWIKSNFGTIYLPHDERHYWSPQLTLSLEDTETGSLLRGLYGPRAAVWTMFVFFYSLIGFAVMIIAVIGLSNLSLEKSGAILWWVPVLIIIFLTLYLVAYFGQKMASDQLTTLHRFIEESVGLEIPTTKV